MRLPNGVTHFVVVWRRHGRVVQVMDPAVGRRWTTIRRLGEEVLIHTQPVPAAAWRAWAGSDGFLVPLGRRLKDLRVGPAAIEELTGAALADAGWRSLAALDAATRAVAELVGAGALGSGPAAERIVRRFADHASGDDAAGGVMPDSAWSVRRDPDARGEEGLLLRGAVLVSVPGRRSAEPDLPALSPELRAALTEPPWSAARELLRLLRADGLLRPLLVTVGAAALAVGVVAEALLFRALIDGAFGLGTASPGLVVAGLFSVGAALLVLESGVATGALGVGRRLEARLRTAFAETLPRLPDRYFRSRPVSDTAERAHLIHHVRLLPELAAELLRLSLQMVLVAAGIAWIDPSSALPAVLAVVLAMILAAGLKVPLQERDLRLRNHSGALSRFSLDALLGVVPLRVHAGERAVRHEYDELLASWSRAGAAVVRATVSAEALQTVAGFALAIWIVAGYLPRAGDPGTALLLVFWALTLPVLAQQIGLLARQYPMHRNLTLRFLEPLGALRMQADGEAAPVPGVPRGGDQRPTAGPGVEISLHDVSVSAGGHTVLHDIALNVPPGSHVVIVGAAGSGKSTLLGLLLGWHVAATGSVTVDGAPLDAGSLPALRRRTAWVDPAVQLWNRSLRSNLRYGAEDSPIALETALSGGDLGDVLGRLPEGLDAKLGEGGALVSGGEGQRVRLGRALLRPAVDLALLDEPFRGLDRDQRTQMLARVRAVWSTSTLLCVTHDVRASESFERVLVMDGGRLVEDGPPSELAARHSRYRELLDAEDAVRDELVTASWRRLRLVGGHLEEPTVRR